MTQMNQQMEKAEGALLHTYNRFPVVFDHGKGVYLYDTEGKEYLDFAAGIAVSALGYGDETYTNSLKNQVEKLLHISNLYYNQPTTEAAEKLLKVSGMDRVFFTNSGTEAIEGALKAARKYSFAKYGAERYEIIAMNHSFHGRSMGALSVTGTEKYRTPFEPLIGGVKFAEYNDLESVKNAVTEKTCAVPTTVKIFEILQKANPFLGAVIGQGTSYSLTDVLCILIPVVAGTALCIALGLTVFKKKDLK